MTRAEHRHKTAAGVHMSVWLSKEAGDMGRVGEATRDPKIGDARRDF